MSIDGRSIDTDIASMSTNSGSIGTDIVSTSINIPSFASSFSATGIDTASAKDEVQPIHADCCSGTGDLAALADGVGQIKGAGLGVKRNDRFLIH